MYLERGGSEVYTTKIVIGVDASGKKKKRGDEEDDQVVGIFKLTQKNPDTVVNLKVDEAVEGCTGK